MKTEYLLTEIVEGEGVGARMHSECRHIMPSREKCHAAALRGTPYCYFHTRVHRVAKAKPEPKYAPLKLPVLEDRSAIQLALAQILDALASARIDSKQAGLLLYGLQIASTNISGDASVPTDTVMNVTCLCLGAASPRI